MAQSPPLIIAHFFATAASNACNCDAMSTLWRAARPLNGMRRDAYGMNTNKQFLPPPTAAPCHRR
jgi:hypothetical protein